MVRSLSERRTGRVVDCEGGELSGTRRGIEKTQAAKRQECRTVTPVARKSCDVITGFRSISCMNGHGARPSRSTQQSHIGQDKAMAEEITLPLAIPDSLNDKETEAPAAFAPVTNRERRPA